MTLDPEIPTDAEVAIAEAVESAFKLTAKQRELQDLARGRATHVLAAGGSRSGKTVIIMRIIVIRALRQPGSRHLIVRHRFSHVTQSVWHATFPEVMKMYFPEVRWKEDKANWFIEFPNGSQIWFAGSDDKDRVDKVLGNEYSTIFFNECSEIPLKAWITIRTRLAQNVGLKRKAFYDCNPPMTSHWVFRTFIERRQAFPPHALLEHPEDYAYISMNPVDNLEHLDPSYVEELKTLPAAQRLRFYEGKFDTNDQTALWSAENIETYRVTAAPPQLQKVVIGVDPSGTKGADGRDEVGIVVVGLGLDGHAYVLDDCSVSASPAKWGEVVIQAYERYEADWIVAEVNYGGALVHEVIRGAASAAGMRCPPYKEVTASRGKVIRAQPMAAWYERGHVHHVSTHMRLEDQMVSMTSHGYMGSGSPDRVDALCWALAAPDPSLLRGGPDGPKRRKWGHPVQRTGTWETDPETGAERQISYTKCTAENANTRFRENSRAGKGAAPF